MEIIPNIKNDAVACLDVTYNPDADAIVVGKYAYLESVRVNQFFNVYDYIKFLELFHSNSVEAQSFKTFSEFIEWMTIHPELQLYKA